jgi:hypothetical protein
MYWPEIVAAAIQAAMRGDRDTFERLLESHNGRFQQVRDAIRSAGEALLDGPPPELAPATLGPATFLPLIGKSESWFDSHDPGDQARQFDRELRARTSAAHPDRLTSGDLGAQELKRRLTEVSTQYTALLIALRTLVEPK